MTLSVYISIYLFVYVVLLGLELRALNIEARALPLSCTLSPVTFFLKLDYKPYKPYYVGKLYKIRRSSWVE